MIRATFYITDPKEVVASATFTMTIEEWEQLHTALQDEGDYTVRRFNNYVRSLLDHAKQHIVFTPKDIP